MSVLLILMLLIIIIILAAICIQRGARVASLKKQVDFLEYSLGQITETENKDEHKK